MQWIIWASTIALSVFMTTTFGATTNITSLCSPYATPPALIKGQPTHVCINVNDQLRTVFMPVADQFTALRITDSWNDTRIGANNSGAFVTVSSMAMRSSYKLYASDAGQIFPYLTAVISVKKGQIIGVTWDDGCYFCDYSSCTPNIYRFPSNLSSQVFGEGFTCYNEIPKCSGVNASACDLTVYVGWTGTDVNGNYLSSAGLRISQFEKYSISSYFKQLTSGFSNFLPTSRFDAGN